MKKVTSILMMFFCVVLLASCTDTTEEFEEITKIENETQLIEPDETGEPDDEISEEG